MSTVKTYTIGKVMQLIPLNEGNEQFNLDFYIKAESDFHFAVVDQTQLDEGALLDFKQSNAGEVSGNIKNNDNKSFYIALKSLDKSTDLTVSLAHRPIEKPPPPPQRPPQQQQQRPPPQQQQQRPPPQQQQQRPPPQQQQRRPPQQQQRRPPQQQQRRPPQQQQRRPPQQQQRRPQQQKPASQKQKAPPKPNNHKQVLKKSGKTYIGVVCAVVVLLIGGGAVWYFCIRKNTTDEKKNKVVDASPALPGGGDLKTRRMEAARRERLATRKYDLLIKRYQRDQAAVKKCCKTAPVVKPSTKTENASLLKKISKLKG